MDEHCERQEGHQIVVNQGHLGEPDQAPYAHFAYQVRQLNAY